MTNYKLNLKETLYAIDIKNRKYYDKLPDEKKKGYQPYVLMRFMSSAPDQAGIHEYFLQMINDTANENLWDLYDHPKLAHLLLCISGIGKKNYHPWIKPPTKKNDDIVKSTFLLKYPGLNKDEINILVESTSPDEFQEICEQNAFDDKEIKKAVEQFKKAKNAKK